MHNSCLTEVERYETKGKTTKKKQTPQERWSLLVQASVEKAPSNIQSALRQIANQDNVPRKQAAFYKFGENSLRLRQNVLESIWKYLCEIRDMHQKKNGEDSNKHQRNSLPETKTEEPKSVTKVEQQEKGKDDDQNESEKLNEDDIYRAMKEILSREGALPRKQLRKKVQSSLGIEKRRVKHLLKRKLKDEIFLVEGKIVRLS